MMNNSKKLLGWFVVPLMILVLAARNEPGPVDEWIGQLRSESLQEAARRQLDNLDVRDSRIALSAVDFFFALRAKSVLYDALPKTRVIHVKTRMVESVVELSEPGDVKTMAMLVEQLRRHRYRAFGGSDAHWAGDEYRRLLVSSLGTMIGVEFGEIDVEDQEELGRVIETAEGWLEEHNLTE